MNKPHTTEKAHDSKAAEILQTMDRNDREAVKEALQTIEDMFVISRREYRLLVGYGLAYQSCGIVGHETVARTQLGFEVGDLLGVK
jgi:hypothetical protein